MGEILFKPFEETFAIGAERGRFDSDHIGSYLDLENMIL